MMRFKIYVCLTLFLLTIFRQYGFAQESSSWDSLDDLLEQVEYFEIVVSAAGKKEEKIADIPASVVVITREEIETYGYTTLEEILENITGFYQVDECSWTGSTNYGVRGFLSAGQFNDLTIMVNGVNQVEDMYNSYPAVKFGVPVQAIDKIEVVRGPMSVIYGSGAFFGAINIVTNESADEQKSRVSTSYGTQNRYRIFNRVAGSSEDFRYFFNGAIYGSDGLDAPYSKMASTPFPEFWGLRERATTKGQLENHTKYFNFSGDYKDFSFNMSLNETEKEMLSGIPSVGDGSLINAVSGNVALGYKKEFSDMTTLDTKFTYHSYRVWSDYEFIHEDFFGINSITSDSYESEANLFIHPLDNLNVTAGLFRKTITNIRNHLKTETMSKTYLNIPIDDDININAIFTQIDYTLFDNLKFTAGVRLEKMEDYTISAFIDTVTLKRTFKFDAEMIPRGAVIYSLNNKNVFKLLYGQAIKQPSMGENLDLLLQNNSESLQPANIQTLELNYMTSPSPNFSANISIFRNELDKLISREMIAYTTEEISVKSSNAGKMVTNGAEIGLKFFPFQELEVDLSGSYQKSTDNREGFEDIDLGYSPEFLGYFKAAYRFPQGITCAISGNYVDEMLTIWQQTGLDPSEGKRLSETKSDAYFIINVNLRINGIYKEGLFLNFKGSNLLDKEIHYPTTAVNAWADKGLLGNGTMFLVSLGWEF
ncbi:MAG: hypothetical protein B6244_11885 [Candidatus Cloacimonetes bacterium 4572_55]|nr:MAG: hypothetical protein B6244_11885 [Candidatus Cloacimonetes bacterium 4572_55]